MFENSDSDKPKILTESEVIELQNKHGVILFYMDGCGHCEVMKPTWNKLMQELKEKHKNEIILGAVESKDMERFKKSGITPSVSGFPTILYFHPNNITRHEAYNGDRSYEDLKKWILGKKDKKGKTSLIVIDKYKPNIIVMKKGSKGIDSMNVNTKGLSQSGGASKGRRNTRRKKSRRHLKKKVRKSKKSRK